MDSGFGWVEDPAVAPHRVLRVRFPDRSGKFPEFEDSALVEVDGRAVLALSRLGVDNQDLIGAFDLETGAQLPDRSGLHRSSQHGIVLGAGRLLATAGPQGVVTLRDAVTGAPVRVLPPPEGGRSGPALGTVDGRAVVFATELGVVTWDVATGERVARRREFDDGYFVGGYFVEHRGRMLVTGHLRDGSTRFHDALTGEAFGAPFRGHERIAERLTAVDYEGRLIVASRRDSYGSDPILIWDAETAAEVLTPPPSADVECYSMALVDGRPLLLIGRSAKSGQSLTLWDPVAGQEALPGFFDEYDQGADKVALGSLAGGFFAVVVGERRRHGQAELWTSTSDGRRRVTLDEEGAGEVALGTVDGRPTVALGNEKGVLRLFDVETAREFTSPFYGGRVRDSILTGGVVAGRGVAILCGSPTRVWDLAAGIPVARLDRFTAYEQRFAVGELGGREVLAVVADAALTVWDFDAAEVVSEVRGGFRTRAGVVFTEVGGRTAVTAEAGGELRTWDAATGEPVGRPYPLDTGVAALAAGLVGDRPVVFLGGGDGRVRAWEPATGEDIMPPLAGHNESVRALAYGHADGRAILVSGSSDNTVRVWDAATGSPVGEPFNGHGQEITSVHVAERQGEPVVVSTARVGAPRMWMLRATPVDSGHTDTVEDLAGGYWAGVPVFASGSHDRTVRLWDAATGQPVGAPLTGHDERVTGVAFTGPRRDILVTADASGLVLRWSPHADGPRAEPLARLAGKIVSVAAADVDGRSVVGAATEDGVFELWDAGTWEPYATLRTDGVRTADLGVTDGRLVGLTVGPNDWPTGVVTVWDVVSGKPLYTPVKVPEESDGFGAFGVLDGRLVVVQGIDGEEDEDEGYHPEDAANVFVYDAATRTVLARLENEFHFNQDAVVAGSVVLVATDKGVIVMDPRTSGSAAAPYTEHAADVTCLAAVEVAGRIVVASGDLGNAVHIWDLRTRQRLS